MQREMFWMFLVLLLCKLTHLTWSESTDAGNDKYQIVYVRSGDSLTVPCPNVTVQTQSQSQSQPTQHVNFELFRDNTSISKSGTNSTTIDFSFKLTGVNTSSCGMYRCDTIILYPPPKITKRGHVNVMLFVEELPPKVGQSPQPDRDGQHGFHWIWIIAVICGIYSIIITIVAVVIQVKMKNKEAQNDYMNTKPKAPRERRKKKGVQNPAPWYC